MPADTGIYAQIQQPKIDSPITGLAQMAQLRHFEDQSKLSDLTFAEKQREIVDQQGMRDAISGAGNDPKAAQAALMRKGFYKPAIEIGKAQTEQQKTQGEIQDKQVETAKKVSGMVGSASYAIVQNPTYENAIAVTEMLRNSLPPDFAAKIDVSQIPRDPEQLKQWANNHYLKSIETDKIMADVTSRRNNDQTNATSIANNAATNATTRRGQDLTNARAKDQLKAPTEFQGKSAGYGARAEQADKIITSLEGKYNPAAINSKLSVESTPLVGGILGAATNKFALSANDQRAEQAQRDFVNAVLRQESGASISASEFDNARSQYFPQPGDSKDVLTQKAQNRKLAIQGFKNSAGKANFSSDAPIQPVGGDIHAQADAILQGK